MHQRRIKTQIPLGGGSHILKVKNKKLFEKIISLENLFSAWRGFKKGKTNKKDVQNFEFNLENNLFRLHEELKNNNYQHSHYTAFNVSDPKLRRIHKATVRDRVLHHAIFRLLYPLFDKSFIYGSYSCRTGKGTHRAVKWLEKFCRQLSKNNTQNIFALKCDIKKFFDSINQDILLKLIRNKITDKNSIWLIEKIIKSFPRGLPLGNVTSQLFANIYLNELDQFAKHKLKEKYYLRYCDDFIILGKDEKQLLGLIKPLNDFLKENLKLSLHPDKIILRKFRQGIDFLGYVVLPHHRVLRTKTKRRILKKLFGKFRKLESGSISKDSFNQSKQSYLGILKHCKGRKIRRKIEEMAMA